VAGDSCVCVSVVRTDGKILDQLRCGGATRGVSLDNRGGLRIERGKDKT